MKLTLSADGSFEISKEVKASCGNCRFVYYDPNDREELQKCYLAGKLHKHPANPEAKEALDKKGLDVYGYCEHHILADIDSDKEVVY